MTSMDSQSIERLIRELDTIIPREGAHVRLEQLDGGPEESVVSANREGYLRLGVEFLKAGIAPEPESTVVEEAPLAEPESSDATENGEEAVPRERLSPVNVDLDYLITGDSLVKFTVFRRGNLLVSETPERRIPVDRLLTVGCLIVASIAAFFAVIGFSEVITWITL